MIWPSTIIGLIRTPQSSTATTLRRLPLARAAVDLDHDGVRPERDRSCSAGRSSGRPRDPPPCRRGGPCRRRTRRSWIVFARSGAPLTKKRPRSHSRSSGDALEQVGGDLARLLAQLAGDDRGRTRRRPASSGSRRCRGRRACCRCRPPDLDVLGRDTELLGDDLRERRLVPLPLRLDAELEDRLAGGVDSQLGRVEHLAGRRCRSPCRARADHLGERGEADAEQPALLARRALLLAQLLVAELLEREVRAPPGSRPSRRRSRSPTRTGTAPAG